MWGRRTGGAEDQPVRVRFIPTHVGQTDEFDPRRDLADRFIPTHVGQTANKRKPVRAVVRFIPTHVGQTRSLSLPSGVPPGSSPRMWGRPVGSCGKAEVVARFIPTHVGQTLHVQLKRPQGAVHPHACGADCIIQLPGQFLMRFIPTHVGQTPTRRRRAQVRSRFIPTHVGQTSRCTASTLPVRGSSPRMWGRRGYLAQVPH